MRDARAAMPNRDARMRQFLNMSTLICVLLLVVICDTLLGFTRYAMVAPPGFDGAMNLNTALSFVHGHGYGFVYNEFFPFAAQTDGPYTLPAGLLMLVGGVTPLTTQGVNLAYLFGLAFITCLLLKRLVHSMPWALAGAAIALLTPGLVPFGMNGFGEVPTLFWFLLTLTIIAPAFANDSPTNLRLLSGGITLGLCYLTKVVSLIMVGPTFVLIVILLTRHLRGRAVRVLWFVLGSALPVIGWELFRFAELGSLAAYKEWWRLQLGQILSQSGASESLAIKGFSVLMKGGQHLQILAGMVGLSAPILVCFLVIPWIVGLALLLRQWLRGRLVPVSCLAPIVSASIAYFVWWLFVTPTDMAWPRRILDGLILQQLLVVTALAALANTLWHARRRAISGILLPGSLAAVLVLAEILVLAQGETLSRPPSAPSGPGELALARKLRALPPGGVLFGFGWWQAPVLALFSGRTMMNFYHWSPAAIDALPQKYLVLDRSAVALASRADVDELLAMTTHKLIASGAGGLVYELGKVLPYPPFTNADLTSKDLASGFDFAKGPYFGTRGIYAREGDRAWVEPDAALLLRRARETGLLLSIYIPPQLLAGSAAEKRPLRLHVASRNCLDALVPIEEAGPKTIRLPLTCPAAEKPGPIEISLHLNGHVPFTRQIDSDPRRLAYLMISARLIGP